MISSIQRRGMAALWLNAILITLMLVGHTALCIICTGDWIPVLAKTGSLSAWGLTTAGLILLFTLASLASLVMLAQTLWREDLLSDRTKWVAHLFWLGMIVPFWDSILLIVASWKRGMAARILAGAYLSASCGALIAGYVQRQMLGNPFGYGETRFIVPGFLSLVILVFAGILFLALIACLADLRFRKSVAAVFCLVAVTVSASAILPYVCINRLENRLKQSQAEIRALGAKLSPEECAAFYFQGIQPDPEWCKLVDDNNYTNDNEKQILNILYGNQDILKPEDIEKKQELLVQHKSAIATLERLFQPGAQPVRYNRHYARPITSMLLPDLSALRQTARYFRMRTQLACLQKSRTEALRQYAFLRQTARSSRTANDNIIGGLVGIACEGISLETLSELLTSGLLTADDLDRIEAELEQEEPRYTAEMNEVMRGESGWSSVAEDIILCGGDIEHLAQYKVSPLRNLAGAPLYCFFLNDYKFVLDCRRKDITITNSPGWTPETGKIPQDFSETMDVSNGRIFAGALLPAINSVWKKVVEISAKNRMARIACRIEKFRLEHGRLPKNLSEIGKDLPICPIDRKQFEYHQGMVHWAKSLYSGTGYLLLHQGEHEVYFPVVAEKQKKKS